MIPQRRNLWFLVLLIIITKVSAACTRTCGTGTSQKQLPFPFGVSDGCEIRLHCSNKGDILLGDFKVHKFTSDSIFVNIPPSCNRSVQALSQLFAKNYAPRTLQNVVLLGNCRNVETSQLKDCMLSETMLKDRFDEELGINGCGLFKGRNGSNNTNKDLKCFTDEDTNKNGFMSLKALDKSGCDYFFSAIALHEQFINSANSSNSEYISTVSLEFQKFQLGWWMEGNGDKKCIRGADVKNITSLVNEVIGYRCSCPHGSQGDGYIDSSGCSISKDSACSIKGYVIGYCGFDSMIGILLRGIVAGAILTVGLFFFCKIILQKCMTMKSKRMTRNLLSDAAGACDIPFYCYKDIYKATDGFADNKRKGTGAYGTVYAGKLHNDKWVAIKKIRQRGNGGIDKVVNEIKLLSSVKHPNLVRLLGCCIDGGEQILIYEFMPNGTLSEHLQREMGSGLPWTIRLRIASETAQAISHLHSSSPPIFHRDIKSSNILLDFAFNSKVADFGLSRLGSTTELSHISTGPQGTPGYVDPQYHQDFQLSSRSDVYSFGVVLLEIITGLKAVDFSRSHGAVNLATFGVEKISKACVNEIIDPFLDAHNDAWTHSSVHKVVELAFRCLAFQRDLRPSIFEVAAELEYIKAYTWSSSEGSIVYSSCASPFNRSGRRLHDIRSKLGTVKSRQSGLLESCTTNLSSVSVEDT